MSMYRYVAIANKLFTITVGEVENIATATVGDTYWEPRRQHLDTETQPRMCTCIYLYTYDVCVVRLPNHALGGQNAREFRIRAS